jgi:hypothetical protein
MKVLQAIAAALITGDESALAEAIELAEKLRSLWEDRTTFRQIRETGSDDRR